MFPLDDVVVNNAIVLDVGNRSKAIMKTFMPCWIDFQESCKRVR